ncbi:HAD-IIIA family hydrolase [Flavisolibacter nicotianae]|uniref:HAD-IIIA family hydrolase n=1 Tax=Flavisolibacter nicotianae TaxID=2364882 RepID=UPI0019696E97|nr:HAD-IIIA family hydrolase [Flavisolibacter nicotianae]
MNSTPSSLSPDYRDIREVIVLAGGLGTRLRDAVPDLPKVMAPVAGRPFLSHVIDSLRMQGLSRFVFSLGYKADTIVQYLKEHYPTLDYVLAEESEPLGTGGGIRMALQKTREKQVLIVNGDTLFRANVAALADKHRRADAECTLALKPMKNFDRYGAVQLDKEGRIGSFEEKRFFESGLINGGVYLLDKEKFFRRAFPPKFSFEKDYLEKYCSEGVFYASVQEGYFIDIGIPADFEKAQEELASPTLDLKAVDKSWTLFIDRDGVINEETVGEYVLHWGQFIFSRGVLHSFKKLSDVFGKLIIITNQRGVGKGLMTNESLDSIHYEMQREVKIAGGHIEKIYYCTDVENTSYHRKPNPGMAYQAKQDFPDIDFSKSIMVGNKPSDMRFGRAAGMFTVFLTTTNPDEPFPHPTIDLRFASLAEFAAAL